jgi:hypothetical protein
VLAHNYCVVAKSQSRSPQVPNPPAEHRFRQRTPDPQAGHLSKCAKARWGTMELHADKTNLTTLLAVNAQQFVVPPYQRPYAWTPAASASIRV